MTSHQYPTSSRKGQVVIVCIDNSDASRRALTHTMDFIHPHLDTVVVLHAYYHDFSLLPPPYNGKEQSPDHNDNNNNNNDHKSPLTTCNDSLGTYLREAGERLVEGAVEELQGRGVERVCGEVEFGKAREVIKRVGEKWKAGLVVVGRRGLGKVKEAIMGSLANYCLFDLDWPVLVVN
eukprot:Nk52_evm2s612 gene=Nk52_evmTU2s612